MSLLITRSTRTTKNSPARSRFGITGIVTSNMRLEAAASRVRNLAARLAEGVS